MAISASTFIILIAILGFSLAFHIFNSKRKAKSLTCPLNSDCNAVIHSDFSRLLGIPLETLGILYYGLTAISYGLFAFIPSLKSPGLAFVFLVLTTVAFLFSIYLTLVQAFALRQWCVWCLTSAGLSTAIFAAAALGLNMSLTEVLLTYHNYLVAGLTLGLVLGVGGSTIYNLLYIKFLRDLKISQVEQDILHTVAQVVWLGLIVIIISAFSIYFSAPELHNTAPTFLIKIFVLAVILIGEAMLNILVAPQLIEISFGKRPVHTAKELRNLRRTSFALAAVSLVSWYSLLALLVLPLNFGTSLADLFLYYLSAVVVALVASQVIEYSLATE